MSLKLINKQNLYKHHSKSVPYVYASDLHKDTPINALGKMLSMLRKAPSRSKSTTTDTNENFTLVIILRHCEMLNLNILNNLILLLSESTLTLGCRIHIIAVTDALCSLPVQTLSQAAQAAVRVATYSTPSAWDVFDELCGRLCSGRELPVVFTPTIIETIRTAFAEMELCVCSAMNR